MRDIKHSDDVDGDRKKVVDYYVRMYGVHADRVRADDVRMRLADDNERLSRTLRWLLVIEPSSVKPDSSQVADIKNCLHGSTASARRWFKKFFKELSNSGMMSFNLKNQMVERAKQINL